MKFNLTNTLQRRTVAESVLNATGHAGIDEATLWKVLSTPPVLNDGMSVYMNVSVRVYSRL